MVPPVRELTKQSGKQIYFAATLLMPKEFLEEDLRNEEYVDLLDDDFLHGLARRYGVSAQALVNRLKNLGYIPE